MDISPLAGVNDSAGSNEYRYLGRARTLKAIAALIGLSSVVGFLSGVVGFIAWLAGSPHAHGALAWTLGSTLYNGVVCFSAALLWKLYPAGLLAILGWTLSLSWTAWTFHQIGVAPMPGSEDPAGLSSIMRSIALCLLPLIAYLAWLLVSPRTRAVVLCDDRDWLRREGRLAGTTIAALVVIGLFLALGLVTQLTTLFA